MRNAFISVCILVILLALPQANAELLPFSTAITPPDTVPITCEADTLFTRAARQGIEQALQTYAQDVSNLAFSVQLNADYTVQIDSTAFDAPFFTAMDLNPAVAALLSPLPMDKPGTIALIAIEETEQTIAQWQSALENVLAENGDLHILPAERASDKLSAYLMVQALIDEHEDLMGVIALDGTALYAAAACVFDNGLMNAIQVIGMGEASDVEEFKALAFCEVQSFEAATQFGFTAILDAIRALPSLPSKCEFAQPQG